MVTVSSVHVLFASHYLTVRVFQQWGAYQYHKSWFFLISLMLLCSAFLSFFSAHVSSYALPRFHPHFTRFLPRLWHLPQSLSWIPRNRDHGIASMIAESRPRSRPWPWRGIFSPRVVLNAFLERTCCFCSVFLKHSLIFKWIMDLKCLD